MVSFLSNCIIVINVEKRLSMLRLQRAWVWFPSPLSGGTQQPLTLALGESNTPFWTLQVQALGLPSTQIYITKNKYIFKSSVMMKKQG